MVPWQKDLVNRMEEKLGRWARQTMEPSVRPFPIGGEENGKGGLSGCIYGPFVENTVMVRPLEAVELWDRGVGVRKGRGVSMARRPRMPGGLADDGRAFQIRSKWGAMIRAVVLRKREEGASWI